jgi:Pentapeptide repeats (8 copies)
MSKKKLVRFEEVTPTLLPVAYFDGHLADLISHLKLPIYGGYNDLDEMSFAFLTLPSGKTVVVGEYSNAPRIGMDLYVDSKQVDIPAEIYESCQQLGKSRNQVVWFSEKFQAEIEQLFIEQGDIQEIAKSTEVGIREVIYDPISCFWHALIIYDRAGFPEYWAMLQYNLGTAYYQDFKSGDGDRGQKLKLSLNCYYQSEEIYTQDKYPERWRTSQESLRTVKGLWEEDLSGADLSRANLSGANLSGANLSGANLSRANLSGANFSGANLHSANLSGANLSGVNLFDSNVMKARFTYTYGISYGLRKDLERRGAIFDDRPPVDSRSTISSRS